MIAVGTNKGDKPSGMALPKVVKNDTFGVAHQVLDERSKQVLVKNTYNGGMISDTGANKEDHVADGGIWVKGGGTNQPSLQSHGVAHPIASAEIDALHKLSRGMNWTRVNATGFKLKIEAPRLNLRSESKLEYIAPTLPGVIDIKENMIDDGTWEPCLVGYFLGASLAFGLVRAIAMTLWRNE